MSAADPALTSSSTLKLITKGRRSGLPHVVLLRAIVWEGKFYVLSGGSRSDWVENLRSNGEAKVRLGEYSYDVVPERATYAEAMTVRERFTRKYGRRLMDEWYPPSGLCFGLLPVSPAKMRGAARGELDARSSFTDWQKGHTDYYTGVAEAFDSASEEYDFTIAQNYINRWIRRRSIDEVTHLAGREDTLLEIGAGTGAEAIEISKHVRRIIATDISESMVGLLRMKVKARGLGQKITPLLLPAAKISLARESLASPVDLAYSFNGALNCEPAIEAFPGELSKVLKAGGYFVCSIRNTLCISEMLSHAAALQFDRTNPRKRQPVMISVGGRDIPAVYYSPATFARFFARDFRLKRLIGLPTLLPPAYLSDYYLQLGPLKRLVERAERSLAGVFPFNLLGDQTLFVFQRL